MLPYLTCGAGIFHAAAPEKAGPEPPYFFPQGQGRLVRSQYLLEKTPYSFLTVNDVSLVIV
jgi:hypothetical protein